MFDTRVEILFVFANDYDVHAGMLCFNKRMIRDARTHIRVETEGLANGHVEALESSALRRGDWSFKKNFSAAQGIPRTGLDA